MRPVRPPVGALGSSSSSSRNCGSDDISIIAPFNLHVCRLLQLVAKSSPSAALSSYSLAATGAVSAISRVVRFVKLSAHLLCDSLLFRSPRLSAVCLSVPRQISETTRDTREISSPYEKSGSESKNMTSYFALEVAKYPKSCPKPQNSSK